MINGDERVDVSREINRDPQVSKQSMTMLMTSEKSAAGYNKHNKSKGKKTENVES